MNQIERRYYSLILIPHINTNILPIDNERVMTIPILKEKKDKPKI